MKIYLILLLSIIIGSLYYNMMEKSIPDNINCSFVSTIWTDIFAFVFGIIIIMKSIKFNDSLLLFIGSTLIVEHIWQLYDNKLF